jgi:small subunit ribosomal protein S19e
LNLASLCVAAVARHIYLRSGVGVGGLKKRYGGPKRRGNRPNHTAEGSGSVARKVLQSLEKIKVRQGTSDTEAELASGRVMSR